METYAVSSYSENLYVYNQAESCKREGKRRAPLQRCSSFSHSTPVSYFIIRESIERYGGKIFKGENSSDSAEKGSGFSSSRLSTLSENALPAKQTNPISTLSDTALLDGLKRLRGKERKIQLDILLYITEVEKRGLYLPIGYNSLFEFCTRHLRYSRAGAYRRIQASRCIERFPKIADLLITGELNISLVSLISGVLTKENINDILSLVSGKSYREAEIAIVMYKPIETKLTDRVKPVCVLEKKCSKNTGNDPLSKNMGDSAASLNVETNCRNYNNINTSENVTLKNPETTVSNETNKEEVELKQKFKLEFMVNPEFMKKLERIKSSLSRKYPEGVNFEMLFTILMNEYLNRHSPKMRIERREKRKAKRQREIRDQAGETSKRTNTATNKPQRSYKQYSRNIPAAVRDLVYKRDGGKCAYVSKNGKRCASTWNLEIDHIVPFARGGGNSPGNLRLLCSKHNLMEARRAYGEEVMKKYIQRE